MDFNISTFLGVTVNNDSEMIPRINLTSAPYTYRAKVSDQLDPNKNYDINHLTVNDKITFGFFE